MRETCVNLGARFGRRYRIGWEANGATKSQWPKEDWAWLMELRCQRGKVYPWGGELLEAYTDRRAIGRLLRALPWVLHARGDDEVVIRFHVDHIEAVLTVLKPYRRRQVSDAEKTRLTAMGERFRFGQTAGVQSDFPEPESMKAGRNEEQATHPSPTLPNVTKGAQDAL
jgi:hypothetical protein